MSKQSFIFAGLTALTVAALAPTPSHAAPLAVTVAPLVDGDLVQIARRCWRRPSGWLVCGYTRHYWQPYGYYPAYRYGYASAYYQPYYYPRYYAPSYLHYRSYRYCGPYYFSCW